MIIDAHHHLWQLDQPFDYDWLNAESMSPIRRDFLPPDLKRNFDVAGVDGGILVQTQHDFAENDWALAQAVANPFIFGVVGWVDLTAPDCEGQLERFMSHPKAVGIRHIVQDEPDVDFLIRPDVLRGLAVLEKHGVPFDLLLFVRHLRHAATLADRFTDLPLVIDHLSKPSIKAGRLDDWEGDLRAAARRPNVHVKLSGMVTEADWVNWRVEDLRPYVDVALEAFTPARCLFGSDWPVCELASDYQGVYATLRTLLSGLSDSETAGIFGDNAARFYSIV